MSQSGDRNSISHITKSVIVTVLCKSNHVFITTIHVSSPSVCYCVLRIRNSESLCSLFYAYDNRLWFSVPINSYGHVGTLPPFHGTSALLEYHDIQIVLENITARVNN